MRRGRKTLRDTLADNNRADAWLAAMYGKRPQAQSALPPQRVKRTRSASGKPLEKHVLRAVLDALRHHPKVAWVARMQSGLFMQDDRMIRVGYRGLPDIVFMLKGGRLGCVECKSESGRLTSEQQSTIELIRAHGGCAGVARSVEDAIAILEDRNAEGIFERK